MSKETMMTTQMLTDHRRRVTRRTSLAGLAAIACLLLGAALPSSALAQFGIASFTGSTINADGTPDTQAGSHPYESTTTFMFNTTTIGGHTAPDGSVKDVHVGLPAGLIGNPNAVPQCTVAELESSLEGGCNVASQVGELSLISPVLSLTVPVFNMVPPAGVPAEFGANALLATAFIDISVRTGGDYGLTANLTNITTVLPLSGSSLTLWGVPAELNGSGLPPTALLTMPTQCSGPLTTTISADSWQNPGDFVTSSFQTTDSSGNPVGITGCGQLSFNPTITAQSDTTVADSPAGLDVDLHVPQAPNDPTSLATPALENASVILPAGFALSPAAADGLQACSQAQFGLNDSSEPTCPEASKIGSAEIDSPISADPLTGSIYLAQPHSNPFDSLVAIYVATEADGVLIKLAGNVQPNPMTGQVTTTFDNSPQLPFTDFKLDFFGGQRATFTTPQACGIYTTTSDLQPWSSPGSGPDSTPSNSFAINSGCVAGFSPTFTAGSQSPLAGAYAPFALSFSRSDVDQNLSGLTVTLPPGMLAKLAGVAECSDAQIAAAAASSAAAEIASPSCPAASAVGTAATAAGAGSDPLFTSGSVYLTGPYKGAPYGLAVVVPALAGPFDLGTVVVRQALFVDPTDAQVTVVSDPFPTILDGIPLNIQRVDVVLNRANFTLNPTSCNPMAVTGSLTSTGGLSVPVSSRFQVGACSALGFSPSLKIGLSGKGKTRSGNHPTLTATLTDHPGQANVASAKVTLPLSLALDPNNSKRVCPYAVALAVTTGLAGCPANTIVGTATASTPLLSAPLTGSVYLVQGIRFNSAGQQIRTLPTLLIPLRGQLALNLRASTSVNGAGELVNTFSTVPDVPVSAFTLKLTGGSKGLLVITGRHENICKAAQISTATLDAQSGKQENLTLKLGTPCRKKG